MAFKKVASLEADTMIALGGKNKKTGKTNPTKIEGYYLGTRVIDSPKSKTGKSDIHYFQTTKGNVGVWGKTNLDRKIKAVAPGTMVRVEQSGMLPTKNGDMYLYQVEFDDENTIEVNSEESSGLDSSSEESYESESEGNDDQDEGDDYTTEDDDDGNDLAALEAAQKAAAERKAKVQNLINKGKKVG